MSPLIYNITTTLLSTTLTATKDDHAPNNTGGTGSGLPRSVLIIATISSGLSTILSLLTVWIQLKNYRKIALQRLVVRILVMVPIYSLSSLISLYSLDLAFFLDAVRDIYEAFVIYCFFNLLVEYLGGERSLIILLHGRAPISHPFPLSLCLPPLDMSDPFTFLAIKRGVLQYVQIKPVLAMITIMLKALQIYGDGNLSKSSGYTYVSVVYNISVGLSLYCLALFWIATSDDLKPYRPMPKFLCVKGIIFFSFWQGFAVSVLVALGWVRSHRFETEQLSIAIQDTLVCLEMPIFSFLHLYAFSYTDYIDSNHLYSGRLPIWYAIRDAFGYKDIFTDSITTVKGTGFSYRTFEPAAGGIHVGRGRDRRVAAGLRYAKGGKIKYWVDLPGEESDAHGRKGKSSIYARPFHTVKKVIGQHLEEDQGYAPLTDEQARDVVHKDTDERDATEYDPEDWKRWKEGEGRDLDEESSEGESLGFGDVEEEDEGLYDDAKGLEFGDWRYPVLDASQEEAKRKMRIQEDMMTDPQRYGRRLQKKKSNGKGKEKAIGEREGPSSRPKPKKTFSYGALVEPETAASGSTSGSTTIENQDAHHHTEPAISHDHPRPEGELIMHGAKHVLHAVSGGLYHDPDEEDARSSSNKSARKRDQPQRLPSGAYDLVVEDKDAEEEEQMKDRRKGEPGGKKKRVYKAIYQPVLRDEDLSTSPGSKGEHVVALKKDGEEGEEGGSSIVIIKEDDTQAVAVDHDPSSPWSH